MEILFLFDPAHFVMLKLALAIATINFDPGRHLAFIRGSTFIADDALPGWGFIEEGKKFGVVINTAIIADVADVDHSG